MMSDFCKPAKVYVFLAIVGILLSIVSNYKIGLVYLILSLLVSLSVTVLFTWIIDAICKVSVGLAWFLVIGIPLLMMLFLIFGIFAILNAFGTSPSRDTRHRNPNRHPNRIH